VVEAGFRQRRNFFLSKPNGRGDQIGVQACAMGGCCDLDNVTPCRRLSARKMNLEHSEICGLPKYPSPGRGVDLVGARLEGDRVRAIGAAEWTAMSELGEEPQGTQERFTHNPLELH
jgi:hypothetical protein